MLMRKSNLLWNERTANKVSRNLVFRVPPQCCCRYIDLLLFDNVSCYQMIIKLINFTYFFQIYQFKENSFVLLNVQQYNRWTFCPFCILWYNQYLLRILNKMGQIFSTVINKLGFIRKFTKISAIYKVKQRNNKQQIGGLF